MEGGLVADRALKVWSSIKIPVRYWEGLSKLKGPKNSPYKCLVSNKQASFFSYIASIFENYLTVFQSDAPLVPFLLDALEKIFLRLLGLIYKKDSMDASRGTSKML